MTTEYLAPVIQLRPPRHAPPRRGVHGHHPDCPYPTQRDVAHCPVCQGIRKGART